MVGGGAGLAVWRLLGRPDPSSCRPDTYDFSFFFFFPFFSSRLKKEGDKQL